MVQYHLTKLLLKRFKKLFLLLTMISVLLKLPAIMLYPVNILHLLFPMNLQNPVVILHTIELFGNFSSPNNFLMKQQNTQYFAGLVRQREAKVRRTFASTELSNKSNHLSTCNFIS